MDFCKGKTKDFLEKKVGGYKHGELWLMGNYVDITYCSMHTCVLQAQDRMWENSVTCIAKVLHAPNMAQFMDSSTMNVKWYKNVTNTVCSNNTCCLLGFNNYAHYT